MRTFILEKYMHKQTWEKTPLIELFININVIRSTWNYTRYMVLRKAIEMKNNAKRNLIEEEKEALNAAKRREKQIQEGKSLVSARKAELECLEKRIYQSGKITARPEPEGAEEVTNQIADNKSDTIFSIEVLEKCFDKLKSVTGASTTEKTLEKFSAQLDTQNRLKVLRKRAEEEKEKIERKLERKKAELEYQKYAKVKEAARTSGQVEEKQNLLLELEEKTRRYKESQKQAETMIQSMIANLQKLHIHMNPTAIIQKEPLVIVENIKRESKKLIDSFQRHTDEEDLSPKEEHSLQDEKWLPAPYVQLMSNTPLPQQGNSPANPAGSDEEEEVPSRGHLKRQAQLAVEAKSRRKNIKIQLPKRL